MWCVVYTVVTVMVTLTCRKYHQMDFVKIRLNLNTLDIKRCEGKKIFSNQLFYIEIKDCILLNVLFNQQVYKTLKRTFRMLKPLSCLTAVYNVDQHGRTKYMKKSN